MRITNQMMINSSMANIQVNKKQVNTLDTQLSTQKRLISRQKTRLLPFVRYVFVPA